MRKLGGALCGLTFGFSLAAVAGCGGGSSSSVVRPSATQAATQAAACAYGPGLPAAATLPPEDPVGKDIPIDHIVLLMQENRSFDHYYSKLGGDTDGAADDVAVPDSTGKMVSRYHLTTKCIPGGSHSWTSEHDNLDGTLVDNWLKVNSDDHTVLGYFDESDLPFYYALARTFAFSDRHFSSVLGPTWPNRMFYFAGTSWGTTDNTFPMNGNSPTTLMSELEDAGVDWRVYAPGDRATPLITGLTSYVRDSKRYQMTAQFATDLAAGKLPALSIVEGSDALGAASPDEDPPGEMEVGQQFIAGIVNSVMQSPFWKSTAIFITYDENGGQYDHVVPPPACAPDGYALNIPEQEPGFTQYGFRVPFFVVSPYAKRGYVSHQVTDHTSILRFVEARFGMPSMTRRDANAPGPYDMFDFAHPDFSVPTLPEATVDQAELQRCLGIYPSSD